MSPTIVQKNKPCCGLFLDRTCNQIGQQAREKHHERIYHTSDQSHCHHVPIRECRQFHAKNSVHFAIIHSSQSPEETATNELDRLGPVAKAFTSSDSKIPTSGFLGRPAFSARRWTRLTKVRRVGSADCSRNNFHTHHGFSHELWHQQRWEPIISKRLQKIKQAQSVVWKAPKLK